MRGLRRNKERTERINEEQGGNKVSKRENEGDFYFSSLLEHTI
jgi:hypothetical protein